MIEAVHAPTEASAHVTDLRKSGFELPGEPSVLPGMSEEELQRSSRIGHVADAVSQERVVPPLGEPPRLPEAENRQAGMSCMKAQRRAEQSPVGQVHVSGVTQRYSKFSVAPGVSVEHAAFLSDCLGEAKQRLCAAAVAEMDRLGRELVEGAHLPQTAPQFAGALHGIPKSRILLPSLRRHSMTGGLSQESAKISRECELDMTKEHEISRLSVQASSRESVSSNPVFGYKAIGYSRHGSLQSLDLHQTEVGDQASEPFAAAGSKLTSHPARKDSQETAFELLPYWVREEDGSADKQEDGCNGIYYSDDGRSRTSKTSGTSGRQPSAAFTEARSLQWVTRHHFKFHAEQGSDPDYAYARSYTFIGRYVISPFNSKKLGWDIIGMTCISYDTIQIPLQLFDLPDNWFTIFMGWLAMLYWLADIFLTFMTGIVYQEVSRVEMRPSKIALNYARTWLFLDIVVVLPDWVLLGFTNDGKGVARFGKIARILKLLRALRLLRLAKLRKLLHRMEARLNNEYLVCYLQLIKLMVSIAVLLHILGCCWFGVSQLDDQGWVTKYKYNEGLYDGLFQYLTSVHWALSVFQGTMEVYPGTKIERAYAVMVQFAGLIIVSYFISSITHFMTEIRLIHTHQLQRRSQLIRYLCQMNISPELSVRIKQFADKVARTQNTTEEEVEILPHLPEEMKRDLSLELKGPALGVHPLFNSLVWDNKRLARDIVEHVTQVSMHYGEVLFRRGEESSRLYVAMTGSLIYDKDVGRRSVEMESNKQSLLQFIKPVSVCSNEWLCEIALWTHWEHRGRVTARAHCEVFGFIRERLVELTSNLEPVQAELVYRHARKFVNWANTQVAKTIDDLSHMPHVVKNEEARSARTGRRFKGPGTVSVRFSAFEF